MPTGIALIFSLAAAIGIAVFLLSCLMGFVYDVYRLLVWVTRRNQPMVVRATMEEMFVDSTPYAATRNATQALTKGGRHGRA